MCHDVWRAQAGGLRTDPRSQVLRGTVEGRIRSSPAVEANGEPGMALARCQCHEHWSAIEDATGEDDVPDAVADLPSPRQPRRHEVVILQESFLRAAKPNCLRDFRD